MGDLLSPSGIKGLEMSEWEIVEVLDGKCRFFQQYNSLLEALSLGLNHEQD